MPRRGLPDTVRMRHDEHYVEALAASAGDDRQSRIRLERGVGLGDPIDGEFAIAVDELH